MLEAIGVINVILFAVLVALIILLIYMCVNKLTKVPDKNEVIYPINPWNTGPIHHFDPLFQTHHLTDIVTEINNIIEPLNLDEIFARDDNAQEGDPQNVHDEHVNKKYKEKILRTIELNGKWMDNNKMAIYQQTRLEITNTGKADKKMLKVLNRISEGATIEVGLETYSEERILAEVWHRMHSQDNLKNIELLEEAMVVSLKDCISDVGMIECLTGRVHRIIDSLVDLDADDILSTAVPTTAILRAEVNAKIGKLVEDILNSDEELMKEYNSGKETPKINVFRNQLKEKINEYLKDYNLSEDLHEEFLSYVDEAF